MKTRIQIHLNRVFKIQTYSVDGPDPTHSIELSDNNAFVSLSFREQTEVDQVKQHLAEVEQRIGSTREGKD